MILKKLLIGSPITMLFPSIPMIVIGAFYLTYIRAYFLMLFVAFVVSALVKNRIYWPTKEVAGMLFLIILYAFILWMSVIWADDVSRSVRYSFHYSWFALFVGVFVLAKLEREDISQFYNVWLCVGLLIVLMCFAEIFFEVRFPGSRFYGEMSQQKNRPTANFYNENNLAVFLSVTAILFVAKSGKVNFAISVIIWLIVACIFYLILMTGSRGGMLVFLLGIFLYKIRGAFRFAGWSSILKGVFVVSILMVAILYSGIVAKVSTLWAGIVSIEIVQDARFLLLKNSFEAMQENYLLGVGSGGVEGYISKLGNVRVERVHNWLGEVFANTGVLGGGVWLLLLFLMFLAFFLQRSVDKGYGYASFVIFLMFPLWQSIASSMIQFLVFWLFLAVYLSQLDANLRFLRSPHLLVD